MVFVIFLMLSSANIARADEFKDVRLEEQKKKFILLCIDGGGVRGIIPARILQEIEKRTNKPIYELVDAISGNSTGGIIALSLVKPDKSGKYPEYSAKDLVNLYLNHSKDIFHKSLWHKIKTGFGFWGAKYNRENLDKLLQKKLGNLTLADVLKPVMIFSYNLDSSEGHIWDSNTAKANQEKNFYLKDIAAATSAAPTYFDPVKISNTTGKYCRTDENGEIVPVCIEADGGIFANNPAIISIADILRHNQNLRRSEVIVICLGTGIYQVDNKQKFHNLSALNWLVDLNIIDIMLDSSSDVSEWATRALGIEMYSIQMKLPKKMGKLDDKSDENLQMLLRLAEEYINNNEKTINEICNLLLKNSSDRK